MSERVGVAVVGFGYWGVNLARNLDASSTTRLVGVVDPDPVARDRVGSIHRGATTWATVDEMLHASSVEAVVVATPARNHHDVALRSLLAGRHVLVEKPLAMTADEASELIGVAAEANLTLMVGHTFLYSAPVQRLRELIASGELGRIQYMSSQRLSLGRIRRDCDALWNFAPHDLSIICHLLDEHPSEVSASGFSFVQPGIADVCFATMRFPGGEGAGLHVSWIEPRKTRLLTVIGDEKMAIYNDVSPDQKLWILDAGVAHDHSLGEYESMGEFQVRTRAGDIVIPQLPYREPLLVEMEAFGSACHTGEAPLTDGQHGFRVVQILEAMSTSMANHGAPEAVPS